MKKNLLVLSLLLSVWPLSSQDNWSLDECISYALDNNIRIKRYELTARISKNNYLNSKLQYLPSLNGFSNATYNWGRTFSYDVLAYVDQNYLDGNFGAQASITLFNGLQNLNTMIQYKYDLMSNLENVEGAKHDITLEIAAAYLQILLNKELLSLAEAQLELTRLQVERSRKLVEVGNVAKGTLLEIEAQEALERSNVINASNNLQISYLTLTQILNLDSVGGFEIEYPEILEIDENNMLQSVKSIYEEAKVFMPQVKSAEYAMKSQEKALSVARGQRYPRLLMDFVDYSRYNELAVHPSNFDSDPTNDVDTYDYRDQIRDFEYKALRLQLSIPIFNRWDIQNRIGNARVAVDDSRLYLDLTKQLLYESIQRAHADALAALENY
ncbi:MAG: TolC family protein, partial [Bacteroidales bacterium]